MRNLIIKIAPILLLGLYFPFTALAQNGSNDEASKYRCRAKFNLINSKKHTLKDREWENFFSVELNIQGNTVKFIRMRSHYIESSDEFIVRKLHGGPGRRYQMSDKSEETIMLIHLMNTGVIPDWCKSSYSIKSIRNGDVSPRRKIKRRSLFSERKKTIKRNHTNNSVTRSSSNCRTPLDNRSFSEIKKSVGQQSFDEEKLTVAKNRMKASCPVRASQIASLMKMLSFSNHQLELAKYAYQYTYDKQNYSKVIETLTFSTDQDKLRDYIKNH